MTSGDLRRQKDEDLIALFVRDGEREAYAEIYRRYQDIVYTKAFSMLREENRAADVTHDIFVKLFFVLPQYRGESAFKTWLYRIVHNSCISAIKQKQGEPLLPDKAEEVVAEEDSPAEVFSARFDQEKVRETLLRLPPADCEILLLKYDDEFSLREIGGILDISTGAVKMRLARARQAFRALHEEYANEQAFTEPRSQARQIHFGSYLPAL